MKLHPTTALALLLGACWLVTTNQQAVGRPADKESFSLVADRPNYSVLARTKDEPTASNENWAPNEDLNNKQNRHHLVSQQLDNEIEGATKTYERVVLEGSKISISCPNTGIKLAPDITLTSRDRSPFVTVRVSGTSNKHKQFDFAKDKQQTVAPINTERVKWFRNHVLLQNLSRSAKRRPIRSQQRRHRRHRQNHAQRHHHNRQRRQHPRLTGHDESQLSVPLDEALIVQSTTRTTATNMTELNRTTELSQTTTAAAAAPPNTEELQTRDSLTIFSSARQSDPLAENVNELTGSRKQSNTLQSNSKLKSDVEEYGENPEQQKQWYINEFGELVINKATQYFAGKYTCLFGATQSEVLLDVLTDSLPDKSSEQAFKMDGVRFEQTGSDVKVDTTMPFERSHTSRLNVYSFPTTNSSVAVIASFPQSSPLNYDDLGAGNRSIERNWRMLDSERSTERDSQNSIKDSANDYQVTSPAVERIGLNPKSIDENLSMSRLNSTKFSGGYEENKFRPGEEQSFQEIENTTPDSIKDELVPDRRGAMADNQIRDDPVGSINAEPHLKRINNLLIMPQYRHHPVHLVKTETIQASDLRLIPGFLYTKHRLHCPVTGQKVHRDHIYPLIRAICPFNSKHRGSPDKDTDEFKCYRLVEHLVSRLLETTTTESENSGSVRDQLGDCSGSLLEVEWFKNGELLEFDTNGRGKDMSLNLKLINSFEQSTVPYNPVKNTTTNDVVSVRGEGNWKRWTGKEMSKSEASGKLESQPPIQTHSDQRIKWMCPLKGKILEMDGVRKESAGRYTCALKLNISKLDEIIHNLQRLSGPQWWTNWNVATTLDNDKSCCDGAGPLAASTRLQDEQPTLASADQIESQQTIRSQAGLNVPSLEEISKQDRFSRKREPIILASGDSLTKRVALLESILKKILSKEPSLIYVKQLLSRLQNPLTVIQTFSVVVSERAANSSDLWSTITEASNAYARRRLADFHRLKRGSERADRRFKNVGSPEDRLSISTSSEDLHPSGQYQMNANKSNIQRLNELEYIDARQPMKIGSDQRKRKRRQINAFDAAGIKKFAEMEYEMHSAKDDDHEILQTSNGSMHMTPPNNNDARRILVSTGQLEPSKRLLLNNADESIESDIRAVVDSQTKSAQIGPRIAAPSNYANDRNLRPSLRKVVVAPLASVQLAGKAVRGVDGFGKARRRYIGATESSAQTPFARFKRSLNANQRDLDYYLTGARFRKLIIGRGSSASSLPLNDHKLIDPSFTKLRVASSRTPVQSWTQMGGDGSGPNDDDLEEQPPPIIDGASDGRFNKALTLEVDDSSRELVAVTDSVQVAQIDELEGDLPNGLRSARIHHNWNRDRDDEIAKIDRQLSQANKFQTSNTGYRHDQSEVPNQSTSKEMSTNEVTLEEVVSTRAPSILDSGRPNKMDALGRINSDESNYHLPNESLASMSRFTDAGLFTEPIWPLTPTSDDKLDESFMWSAGQYLYMHMRALTASSIFGVEVDVEWSNERSNSTSFDINDYQSSGAEGRSGKTFSSLQNNHLRYAGAHDATPFATIDVIAGQSLQLQCTAHALGRLPEVKWYKLVNSIPKSLKNLLKIVRRIGYDMYWPLTELDLLNEYEGLEQPRSFVSSQTKTIFDNLDNQTFTVVSSLRLSQYNDKVESGTIKSASLPIGGDYNLYACIVDADVRHNYATLGVHFRESPSKISSEISRRLLAKSALTHPKTKSLDISKRDPMMTRISGEEISTDSYTNYNLLRENQLKFPLKNHWIPIQSDSSLRLNIKEFPLSPATLSFIIVLVFGSLLALVYLTLYSYRTITQTQTDDYLSDGLIEESSDQTFNKAESRQNESDQISAHRRAKNPLLHGPLDTRCLCQLDLDGANRSQSNLPRLFEMELNECLCENRASYFVDYNNHLVQERPILNEKKTLYAAHSHSNEAHYIYHNVATSKMSSEKSLSQTNLYGCQQFNHKVYQ